MNYRFTCDYESHSGGKHNSTVELHVTKGDVFTLVNVITEDGPNWVRTASACLISESGAALKIPLDVLKFAAVEHVDYVDYGYHAKFTQKREGNLIVCYDLDSKEIGSYRADDWPSKDAYDFFKTLV